MAQIETDPTFSSGTPEPRPDVKDRTDRAGGGVGQPAAVGGGRRGSGAIIRCGAIGLPAEGGHRLGRRGTLVSHEARVCVSPPRLRPGIRLANL